MRPRACQNDHLDVVILRGRIEGVVEVVGELEILRIADLGAILGDAHDILGDFFIEGRFARQMATMPQR